MPRLAREKSETGIYHLMLRGIDKRDIFLKDSDYEKFLEYIKLAKEKIPFSIYAYCLMTNHVHLLLKNQAEEDNIGDIVKRITVGYVQYHNVKYARTGHLFQNRFRSEAVDNDNYFLTVLRYIHQNPIKAGIVKSVLDYKWSSYKEYLTRESILVETSYALGFFKDFAHLNEFVNESNIDECLEDNQRQRYTDEDLKKVISSLVQIDELYSVDIATRTKLLKNIKDYTGASNRQLAVVLNIGRRILEKVK